MNDVQPERPPYVAEMIPLAQGWETKFLVSVESQIDYDNPYSGWLTVNANADTRTVDLDDGIDLSPVEARNLASALMLAAAHAEDYGVIVSQVLLDEQIAGHADYQDMPIEQQQAVNEWIRRRTARAWRRRVAANPDLVKAKPEAAS